MPKTTRTKPGLVHCVAQCKDCDWKEESYRIAARYAANHARKTGHTVNVDQGYVYTVYGEADDE